MLAASPHSEHWPVYSDDPSTWICNRGLSACERRAKFLNLPSVNQQKKALEQGILLPTQLSKENFIGELNSMIELMKLLLLLTSLGVSLHAQEVLGSAVLAKMTVDGALRHIDQTGAADL
jgi:hypothetical protein